MNRERSILSSVLVLILVPAVVSVLVTWLVLTIWDRQKEPEYLLLPTFSGTALIPPATRVDSGASGGDSSREPDPGETAAATNPPAGCQNIVHTVASGETLGFIAQEYDLTIEQITAMNQLINPDFNPNILSIDQELVIPICGIPTATPTFTPTDTPVPSRVIPTANPTATDLPAGVVIVEVARVLNPGEVTTEAVEIINRGSSVARLGGWRLVSPSGESFVFPPLNLFPQGAVTVYSRVGENTAVEIYWGMDEAVWSRGQTVRLLDSTGKLQHEFEIP